MQTVEFGIKIVFFQPTRETHKKKHRITPNKFPRTSFETISQLVQKEQFII